MLLFSVDRGQEMLLKLGVRDPCIGAPFGVRLVILRYWVICHSLRWYKCYSGKIEGESARIYHGSLVFDRSHKIASEKITSSLFFSFSSCRFRQTLSFLGTTAKGSPAPLTGVALVISEKKVHPVVRLEVECDPCRTLRLHGSVDPKEYTKCNESSLIHIQAPRSVELRSEGSEAGAGRQAGPDGGGRPLACRAQSLRLPTLPMSRSSVPSSRAFGVIGHLHGVAHIADVELGEQVRGFRGEDDLNPLTWRTIRPLILS